MESFYLNCRKNTENIDPEISSTSNGEAMILSKCAICGSKKSRFIKNQELKGLLSKLKQHYVKYQYWLTSCFQWV